MDDFPSNRQRSQRSAREESPRQEEPRKIQRVVEGEIVRRKKPIGRRIKDLLIGDSRNVGDFLLEDMLIPGIKDLAFDMFNAGLERRFYGDSGHRRSRSRYDRGGFGGGNVRYDRMGSDPRRRRERDDPRDRRQDISPRGRAMHDFDEFILPSRAEADEVLSQMYDILENYDTVSVSDLYQLLGTSSSPIDLKWGWTDLFGSGISRTRGGGYLLDLPSPEPLRD